MTGNECLYKYVSAYVGIKILESETIRFSSPKTFNDPYDSDVPILFENTKCLDNKYFINLVKKIKQLPQANTNECEDLGKSLEHYNNLGKRITYDPKKYLDKCFYNLKKYMRILSLSKINDNLLMWGHYADCHKGIVIGFSKSYMLFKNARDVLYSSEIPAVGDKLVKDILMTKSETLEALEKVFLTKSTDWKYEQECRCMFDVRNNYKYISSLKSFKYKCTQPKFIQELEAKENYIHQPFSKNCIKKIFIGTKTNIIDEYRIINIIKSKYPGTKIYKASLSQENFKMIFKEFII
ncbi:DUF2971 domain-containing protein [bacterium]|nr:DUF2971 domain-containing protein [bacterium]